MSDIKEQRAVLEPTPALIGAGQTATTDLSDALLEDALPERASKPRDLSRGKRPDQGDSGNLLANLKISRKLGLIVTAFFIPLIALLSLFALNQQRNLDMAATELRGLEYIPPLTRVLTGIPLHRDLSIRYTSGDRSLEPQLEAVAAEVNEALNELLAVQERSGEGFGTGEYVRELVAGWQALERSAPRLNPEVNFQQHSELVSARVFPLLEQVTDRSGLGLDADLGDFYLSKLALETLPSISESLSQLRDQGSGVVTRGTITTDERQALSTLVTQIRADFAQVRRDLSIATEGNPAYAQELNDTFAEFESLANYTIALAQWNLINRFNTDIKPETFFTQATRSVDIGFDFLDTSVQALTQDLNEQIADLRLTRLLTIAGVLLGLALSILLVAWIARQITRPVDELATVAERVSQGDLSMFARVRAKDELGTLASSFNQAIIGLRQAAERNELERQESEALQLNVSEFLDVAMDIADGDFTKRGMVTEDVLGNVVDAINLMVDEVSSLLKDVRNASESVARGSGGMLSTSNAISDATTLQAREAQNARQVTLEVTQSMREMSQSAQASALAANQALQASAKSQEAVEGTLQGMQNIRREVQAISKRIKSLGDSSLEISEIVDTISAISSQTNLLALNAAMEAAGAGPAGQRFAVVAGEVRKLAEDSAQATQRVATLIRDIQSEVQEVVASVEDGTQEVEAGYQVATEAGVRLQEVAAIIQESAQFARSISDITQVQVGKVENVDSSVSSIADLSQKSQAQVQQGRESAEQLKALAEQLRQNLSHFRLA